MRDPLVDTFIFIIGFFVGAFIVGLAAEKFTRDTHWQSCLEYHKAMTYEQAVKTCKEILK